MIRIKLAFVLSAIVLVSFSQNDLDAIRYSRSGFGGSSRFISMGGAFGAVGADITTAAYNPAGLAIYRKGDISFSTSLKSTNNSAEIYKRSTSVFDLNLTFNNFGFAAAWKDKNDAESRHVVAFSATQRQNFNNSIKMSGYTNSSSIAKDMYNWAEEEKSQGNNVTNNLVSSYEGLAFNTLLLDTFNNKFFSMLDLKRSVKQTRDLITVGKANDWNFSYAYAYKDKFYLGASLGIPQISYESTIIHTEADELDSMQIILVNDSTFSSTYVDDLPTLHYYYDDKLGFNSLEYTEYYKTTGSGVNLKLGGIIRVSDLVRVGFYYHTPTLYRLKDSYYNELSVSYDADPKNPQVWQEPEFGGVYNYRMLTPGKVSGNLAFIIKKLAVIAVDYELVNYKKAKLLSDDGSDFDATNAIVRRKYTNGNNLRIGGELNLNPIMLRVGYNMQGSPYGHLFVGELVRNTFSAGVGFRTKNNFYFDFTVSQSMVNETYKPFATIDTRAKLNYSTTNLAFTVGVKF